MNNKIKLIKNNDEKDWSDLEWIDEFYSFLQGEFPKTIILSKTTQPKLTSKKAFSIIWYLQEHFSLLPCHIERCWSCKGLFDSDSEGIYWESKGRDYCGDCEYLVPDNYDNCKRDN